LLLFLFSLRSGNIGKTSLTGLYDLCGAFSLDRYDPLQLNDGEVKNVNYAYLSV